MKQLFFTLIISIVSFSLSAQANKTFVKSFNLHGSHAVLLDLDGSVEVKQWSDGIVRVLTNIEIDNTSDNTLKALITAGRYKINSDLDGGTLVLTSNPRTQAVKVRGQELNENVTYTVFVPEKINVEVKENGAQTDFAVGQASTNSK